MLLFIELSRQETENEMSRKKWERERKKSITEIRNLKTQFMITTILLHIE